MQRRFPLVLGLIALVLGLVAVVPATPVQAWSRPPARVAGADRYETAARLSAAAFGSGAATVVVASGESFADGLAAGPLAALFDAPVLLTRRDTLPAATTTELARLTPRQLFVVGGTAAISDAVLEELESATELEAARIAGSTRYDTATAVASLFPDEAPSPLVFVASGADFPDALAGGAAAAMAVAPLLLTPPDMLPEAVRGQLGHLNPAETVVLGGPGAVSEAVFGEIDAVVGGALGRLAGHDRYATAAAIAAARASGATQVLLATGEAFPDALAAAPLARHLGAPILLTTTCAPPGTISFQRDRDWPDVTIVGGPAAVGEFGLSLPCGPAAPDGQLAPGVALTTHVLPGPVVARVLTIDRTAGVVVRPVMASGRLAGRLTTTEVARGHRVPAAVNGTFMVPETGEPAYALAVAGRLVKAPGAGGSVIGLDPAKPTRAHFASPSFDISVGEIGVDRVNSGAPGGGEVALFTTEDPRPINVGTSYCRALLAPRSAPALDLDGDTVQQLEVEDVDCDTSAIAPLTHDVLAALEGTPDGDRIAALEVSEDVELSWSVHEAAGGVTDVIGGNLTLVHGNQVASDVTNNTGAFFTERAPRTAIGARADGHLVIVTVDGRQPDHSVGMTPRGLAEFLVSLGCIDAINLDGGGSTSLAVDGVLANRPSGGAQRTVGSALLVDG